MLPRYSNISLNSLDELNAFALSDSPSSAENFSRRCAELSSDSALSGLGMLRKDGYLLLADLTIPGIRNYFECESLLFFPKELRHPVEQVSACLSLLRRQEFALKHKGEFEPTTISLVEVQRRLSHLLVKYPVLMDHRMLIGVTAPDDDWVPIAHAIAETSFACLPRLSDGLTGKQLRLFAANRHVRAGLTRVAPDSKKPFSSVLGRTPQSVAFDGTSAPAVKEATRGAFLLSMLHLDRCAKEMTGRGVVRVDAAERDALYANLAKVVWDVAFTGGKNSNVTRDELLAAMRLRSPFAKAGKAEGSDDEFDLTVATACGPGGQGSPLLLYFMAAHLDSHLFGSIPDAIDPSQDKRFTTDEMHERSRSVISLLSEAKVLATPTEAAEWLATVAVGTGRAHATTCGPICEPAAALGFLQALREHGVAVSLNNTEAVTRVNTLSPSVPTTAAAALRQMRAMESVENWQLALEIFSRRSAMESVIERHGAAEPGTRATTSDAALRARARRVL